MSKITLDNLSDNLKEYMNGLGLTEEQVMGIINRFEEEKIGNVNNLQTESKVVVDAINEVKEYVDNKDLSDYQTIIDENLLTESKNIVEAINEVFQSGNSVKQELVATLVAKGLEATTDMSFNDLINNINDLVLPMGDATVNDVLNDKSFINSSGLAIGMLTNNGSKTITPGKNTQTLSAGYYESVTVNGNGNLTAGNIKSGVTIFGVTGTY